MPQSSSSDSAASSILQRVDHLVLATPDLDRGIEHIRELCGVDAVPGGHHPVYGTRNALVGLGSCCYLEIIGPDTRVLNTEEVKVFGIHELEEPKLVTWAARATDLKHLVEDARKDMIDLGDVTLGSRKRPDGEDLTWTFTDPLAARSGGVLPFFIDWGESGNPAAAIPGDCELLEISLHHPHPDNVRQRLRALGLDYPVQAGDQPRVGASIRTPKGVVDL